ncbi:lactonase family protein [Bradyrhizobium manausense]
MTSNRFSRRTIVTGAIAAGAHLAATRQSLGAKKLSAAGLVMPKLTYAYTGCRTTRERNARGDGVNVYAIDPATAEWKHIQLLRTPHENPSYLAFDRTRRFLYAVHGDTQFVSALKVDEVDGTLSLINTQDCGGKNPVYLTPDVANTFMMIANYATGSVGVLPISEDGSLGSLHDLVQLRGQPGPHKTQQTALHPHMVTYDRAQRFIVVPDKGGDQVCVFAFDPIAGKLVPKDTATVKSRQGAGPRHIVFHPTRGFAYLSNELDSSIEAYAYDAEQGALKPLQILPATPSSFAGDNTAAGIAIAPSGRFVYMSNRGHDSIAIYAVDEKTGLLSPIGWQPTQGGGPRFFTLDPAGKLLYAANELTDTVVAFRVDEAAGTLTPTGQLVRTGSPTCVVFSEQR